MDKSYVKKIVKYLVTLYVILSIIISLSYNLIIDRVIGNNSIIFKSFEGNNYMVYLEKETVNFVEIKDANIGLFGFSRVPFISTKLVYDLREPQKSTYKFDGTKYTLKDDLLSSGIVVKGWKLTSPYGIIESKGIYFGVSNCELDIDQAEKYSLEEIGEGCYVFMFEDEEDIKIDKLYNIGF
ncbi:hypothetical protein [Maledivibacter halophilus]|uniref:Uncharacterized protein n=1 Tax=Maledivibacter halophilus TaxID=36842 RepID=A0A1T5KY82_9FIRM|nr:hypothetical protein [Maledivibacter halophilus]SKC68717.1 hypothetical protein SAMN02194393_02177 [Maledivibacter halophilus]